MGSHGGKVKSKVTSPARLGPDIMLVHVRRRRDEALRTTYVDMLTTDTDIADSDTIKTLLEIMRGWELEDEEACSNGRWTRGATSTDGRTVRPGIGGAGAVRQSGIIWP